MATLKLNDLFTGLSGTIGDLVIGQCRGKLVVRKLRTRTKPSTAAQLANEGLFREAAAYGRSVQHDPALRAPYQAAAQQRQMAPYHVALKDFLNAPKLIDIEVGQPGARPGGLVRVRAADDFEVVQVQVRISGPEGSLLDEGVAQLDLQSGLWLYEPHTLVAPGQTLLIEATALDRPRHGGSKTVFWQRAI